MSSSLSSKTYLQKILPSIFSSTESKGPVHKRFLTDNPIAYRTAIEAAESYVSKLTDGDVGWLRSKPFDPTPGNPQYFRLMFDLINILQSMQIPGNGRILEVGSGPGWVTEILLMLGFSVESLEPSADLIKIARERCSSLASHYRQSTTPLVQFHQSTLEEIEFDEESFDAILFFDVLHHVVNEELAINKSFRFLKPGGCLGVVEGAWHPEFKALEQALVEEMAKFGTLENPFSTEYLDYLLTKAGFVETKRFAAVNGFFSEDQLSQPLQNFVACRLAGSNNVVARKPSTEDTLFPSCTNFDFKTNIEWSFTGGGINRSTRTASLVVDCKNTGETLLDNRTSKTGHITVALRRGIPGTAAFMECEERHVLPEILTPGKQIRMELFYSLPAGTESDNWVLDLVSEGVFWFSTRNIKSCSVPCL
jgi:ubiquinone/menaquinone biosynthesis C-methylase UbiE